MNELEKLKDNYRDLLDALNGLKDSSLRLTELIQKNALLLSKVIKNLNE